MKLCSGIRDNVGNVGKNLSIIDKVDRLFKQKKKKLNYHAITTGQSIMSCSRMRVVVIGLGEVEDLNVLINN